MEEKKNNKLNITYIIIAVIIAVAILGLGAMNYISSEKNRQIEQMKLQESQQIQKQAQEQEQTRILSNQQKLQDCLDTAEREFNHIQEINSYPNPQPSYPDTRAWNSSYVKEQTTQKLQDDKALCAKLYGAQQ